MEIDEEQRTPIIVEAMASILSGELGGLCAGEQALTNAAAGRVIRLPAA